MTHDELLIEVNRRLQVALYNGDIPAIHALRAVVELHKPDGQSEPFPDWANCCGEAYPCQTIHAIEKELNG